MNSKRAVVVCFLWLCVGSAARANDCGNLAMAYLFGYNGWNNRPIVQNNYTPPYFSLHPPVYYGQRYYRPYGASPFAAWPQLQPNPNYMPQAGVNTSAAAAVFENPYLAPASPTCPQLPADAVPTTPAAASNVPDVVKAPIVPLIIDNPYYVEPQQPKLASTVID
ncbi:MAG: hypothetical protein KF752_15345 [Pirellulaceae bacterium]|nr:hypothetical protein [Pirellulaceae bacterium]